MLGFALRPGSPVLARLGAAGVAPPSWTTPPAISGTAAVGQTLTGGDGAVSGGTVTGRQWRRGGVAIAGATATTYLLVQADAGATIDLRVTATGPGGTANATAAGVGPVVGTIGTIVIEGDSISGPADPDTPTNQSAFYSYAWAGENAGNTVQVRAQASRTVGGAAYNGDGVDGPGGNGNTNSLLAHQSQDIGYGAQLLTVMIGDNDLKSQGTATYVQRLKDWAAPIRAAGTKIAYSPPLPYRQSAPQDAGYATYTSRRAALFSTSDVRNPAVWGQWADYYFPMGEQPDFLDSTLDATTYGDTIHPSALSLGASSGQARIKAVFDAFMSSLLDTSRAASTQIYDARWPTSQGNLATGQTYTYRFIVSGLQPTGIALTGANALAASGGAAQLRRGGGAWAASLTGWLYNGDVIDLQVTTSASNATAVNVSLQIGSETRALSFTTVAQVTPVAYVHGDVEAQSPVAVTHTYAARPFTATGTAVIAICAKQAVSGVTVGGAAATRRLTQAGDYGERHVEMWTAPVASTGAKDVVVTFAASEKASALSWGVVTGADPTPTAAVSDNTADTTNLSTGAFTVPASGLALGCFGEYAGANTVAPATITAANTGTTLLDEGQVGYQSEVWGVSLAKRTASGAMAWDFGSYLPSPRGAIVFKAAGT